MILEPGADDLLAVVEIFRPDEAHHGVDEERRERARHRVGAGLERLLVDAVMRPAERALPCPVSKYITLSPTVPRLSASAAARASARSARSMPKLLFAASLPAIDWNTRSTGAPLAMSASVVVTCASTQVWVGMSSLARTSSSMASSACARSVLSVAGLMPMTASPAP